MTMFFVASPKPWERSTLYPNPAAKFPPCRHKPQEPVVRVSHPSLPTALPDPHGVRTRDRTFRLEQGCCNRCRKLFMCSDPPAMTRIATPETP